MTISPDDTEAGACSPVQLGRDFLISTKFEQQPALAKRTLMVMQQPQLRPRSPTWQLFILLAANFVTLPPRRRLQIHKHVPARWDHNFAGYLPTHLGAGGPQKPTRDLPNCKQNVSAVLWGCSLSRAVVCCVFKHSAFALCHHVRTVMAA